MIIAAASHNVYRNRGWQLDFTFQVSWFWNPTQMTRDMKRLCSTYGRDYQYGDPIDIEITADYLESKYNRDSAWLEDYRKQYEASKTC